MDHRRLFFLAIILVVPACAGRMVASGARAPRGGLHIDGRFLKDPCGDTVMIRGYEQPVGKALAEADANLPEMAKTGANYARVLVTIPPGKSAVASVDAVARYITLARRLGMLIEFAIDDGSAGTAVYARDDVKAALFGNEDVALIHAAGEGRQATDDDWVAESAARVADLRAHGYRHVLFVASRDYGRNPRTVLDRGAEVLAADPLRNVHFLVQLYWGSDSAGANFYEQKWGMTIAQAMRRFARAPLAIQAGLLSDDSCCSAYPWIDFEAAMTAAQQDGIGWLWWDWQNPYDPAVYHITTDGKYGSWQSNPKQPFQPNHGSQVSSGHAASVKNTAVRTTYMQTGRCAWLN